MTGMMSSPWVQTLVRARFNRRATRHYRENRRDWQTGGILGLKRRFPWVQTGHQVTQQKEE